MIGAATVKRSRARVMPSAGIVTLRVSRVTSATVTSTAPPRAIDTATTRTASTPAAMRMRLFMNHSRVLSTAMRSMRLSRRLTSMLLAIAAITVIRAVQKYVPGLTTSGIRYVSEAIAVTTR